MRKIELIDWKYIEYNLSDLWYKYNIIEYDFMDIIKKYWNSVASIINDILLNQKNLELFDFEINSFNF